MNKEYNIKNLLQEHIIIVPEMQRLRMERNL